MKSKRKKSRPLLAIDYGLIAAAISIAIIALHYGLGHN
jgi:Flp pilus assembly pilin Flp